LLEPEQPRGRILPLTDLGAVRIAQQRKMRELRRLPAEPLVEQELLRRRADPLLAADDVADLHQVIVDDDREMIGREAVGLQDHLVVGKGRAGLPADQVVEDQRRIVRDEHPDDRLVGEAGLAGSLLARLAQAAAVVARRLAALALLLAHRLEPLGAAPTLVGVAGLPGLAGRAPPPQPVPRAPAPAPPP